MSILYLTILDTFSSIFECDIFDYSLTFSSIFEHKIFDYTSSFSSIFECNICNYFVTFSFFIADVNECLNATLNNCNANANCTNTEGSFTCKCNIGFIGDGYANCTGKEYI